MLSFRIEIETKVLHDALLLLAFEVLLTKDDPRQGANFYPQWFQPLTCLSMGQSSPR